MLNTLEHGGVLALPSPPELTPTRTGTGVEEERAAFTHPHPERWNLAPHSFFNARFYGKTRKQQNNGVGKLLAVSEALPHLTAAACGGGAHRVSG